MTPLASAVALIALAVAVIAVFAVRLHRAAGRETVLLPHPSPAAPVAPAVAAQPAMFEGALIAGD